MEELNDWEPVSVPSTGVEIKPMSSVEFKRLVNEVQQDQWHGASNFSRATAARAELFSRLRFPKSSIAVPMKRS